MFLLEKEKDELKTLQEELTNVREKMMQKVIDYVISDVSSLIENTHIIQPHGQSRRLP